MAGLRPATGRVGDSHRSTRVRGAPARLGGLVLRTESPGRVGDERHDATARTILVVEDSEPIRRILALLLEGHGYEVVAVDGGREGLALAQQLHPCAITLDISLPDLDGREVLRALKSDARTQT